MDKLLLRPLEVAEALGIGRSKVYELLAAGALPVIRVGRSVRVPAIAVSRWVERELNKGEPQVATERRTPDAHEG